MVDKAIKTIEEKFGNMPQTRGDKQDFLGMNIKFKENKVKIRMKKHIQKVTDTVMDDITRKAVSLTTRYLFKTSEAAKLTKEKPENFHSVVASLLFISRRCRLDIQTAGALLCTRVAEPDKDDWKRLKRVLQYLRGIINIVLTLGADNITKMKL